MNEDQIEEYNDLLRLYAGIALPGIMVRVTTFTKDKDIAKEAFDVAEAMIVEFNKRKHVSDN